jgi:hypothetical protein
MFKAGDRVKVVRQCSLDPCDRCDKAFGHSGIVEIRDNQLTIMVKGLPCGTEWLRSDQLELIEDKPNNKVLPLPG